MCYKIIGLQMPHWLRAEERASLLLGALVVFLVSQWRCQDFNLV
jgi:hypothetical protein